MDTRKIADANLRAFGGYEVAVVIHRESGRTLLRIVRQSPFSNAMNSSNWLAEDRNSTMGFQSLMAA